MIAPQYSNARDGSNGRSSPDDRAAPSAAPPGPNRLSHMYGPGTAGSRVAGSSPASPAAYGSRIGAA